MSIDQTILFHRAKRGVLIGVLLLSAVVFGMRDIVQGAQGPQGTPDADAHKAWMNDASDAEEDFRFAVSEKDAKAAAAALTKIERLMQQTETYWTAKKANDGVTLAKETRAQASQAAAAAGRGNLAESNELFTKMTTTCNSCHELHLEKR